MRSRLALALGGMLMTACTTDVPAPTAAAPPAARQASAEASAGQTPEHTSLQELTRAVALALRDQGLRSRVLGDLRQAPFKEHKLELRRYLAGGSGGLLLAKMAQQTGRSREALLALTRAVRPLEFYMPVPAHRSAWRGGAGLLVAALLEDDETPVAYALDGTPVTVAADRAPTLPTLVLVPIETDFTHPLDVTTARNADDQNGQSIGTYLVPCDDCDGGGGTVTKPAGLYMTFARLHDMGEPWTKGDPEIEVHIHGPSTTLDITEGADLSCSGQHASNPYKRFDYNSGFWRGDVLLFTQAEIDAYNQRATDGYNVLFWEDDDGACQVKNDKDNIKGAIQTTKDVYQAASVRTQQDGLLGIAIRVGRFVAAVYKNASFLLSNDDWLGDTVDQRSVGTTYTDANHVTMKGTTVNGRAMLMMRR